MWQRIIPPLLLFTFVVLVGHRIWQTSAQPPLQHVTMPASSNSQRELHLTPGGCYTNADIEANGDTTPLERFRKFQPRHDFSPKPGDALCPISRTKANPLCSWVVNGSRYAFCCPPCIDEFVRLAKEDPQAIRPPEEYVSR